MKKIWMNKPADFKEAEEFDLSYYFKMSPQERLETVQLLREMYFKIKNRKRDENTKRLRRVVKIIQQA